MSTHGEPRGSTFDILQVLRDVMLGGAHSRVTVARAMRVSLPTADRWIKQLAAVVPGCRLRREGKTTWLEYRGGARRRSGVHPELVASPGRCPYHEEKVTATSKHRLCGCPVDDEASL